MKKLFISFLLFFGFVFASQAQNIDAETIKTVIKTEKRIFFTENMNLSLEEAGTFWALYDEYELASQELVRERTQLFKSLINDTDGITDEEATTIVDNTLEIQAKNLKLKKKYIKMMKKQLSPKTVARFVQLNELVNNFLKTQILAEMPVITQDPQ
ncbi:hypothetical protein KMW28_00085 [Flammeovirga yaeyamensis]|uniref:Sensor of ECF-type sigma factor n=1 Tax=Flammeovirga yaeyamensis TaxID=367791 RepID=A0AAX1N3A5_9BACT|nr:MULTISPECIES: hypothetical protein [Flammeovirga]ANQ50565.1 hypothetical protein MY04_3200 [Flammeovirga sp. MY04]MBB3700594.1 hypothetical protein [Flammeovirga yaeyamensis]NMF37710.1 hypothetical protein [Flammeovirga yaeyamensis]QWG02019.1 hypothetical protein KMW28_00085 [Flammeovirga yaeyamensis]